MYHATKWGIEGFVESVAQEVVPFAIGMTLVEPGGARTEFRYGQRPGRREGARLRRHARARSASHPGPGQRARHPRPRTHGGRDHRQRGPGTRTPAPRAGIRRAPEHDQDSTSGSPASRRKPSSPPRPTARPESDRLGCCGTRPPTVRAGQGVASGCDSLHRALRLMRESTDQGPCCSQGSAAGILASRRVSRAPTMFVLIECDTVRARKASCLRRLRPGRTAPNKDGDNGARPRASRLSQEARHARVHPESSPCALDQDALIGYLFYGLTAQAWPGWVCRRHVKTDPVAAAEI